MTIAFKRIEEVLSKKAMKDFREFMSGQTVEGNKKGETLVFEEDFIRWMNKLPVID